MRKRKYVSLGLVPNTQAFIPGTSSSAASAYVSEGRNSESASGSNSSSAFVLPSSVELNEKDFTNKKLKSDRNFPIPQCHNIVSTSQIVTSQPTINLQRLADLFPFTTYDRKRFAAITIRLANPHCTCLLFGSGKLVITGSTSFRSFFPLFFLFCEIGYDKRMKMRSLYVLFVQRLHCGVP